MASSVDPILKTDLSEYLPLVAQGKVREIYTLDGDKLLFVATDRVSAFDVVMKNGIPHKGALLTMMSVHWYSILKSLIKGGVKTHFISLDLPPQIESKPELARVLRQRTQQVRKLKVFPIESIVRGYITGSAWAEYKENGTVHGIPMPESYRESQRLTTPIWTPSTKAELGGHDENISPDQAAQLVGKNYADRIRDLSLEFYSRARDYAYARGIIIADTKFEFALDTSDDSVVLVDEVLTPDSSRFWPVKGYEVGKSQRSLDKQSLRDWLTQNGLKGKQDVEMPPEVVQKTFEGYKEAFERLVGTRWDVIIGDDQNGQS